MNFIDAGFWTALGFGVLAGLLTVALAGRWLRFVLALRTEPPRYVDGAPRPHRRLWGMPLLSFFHPVPWMVLVALPLAAYHFVWVHSSPAASPFFGALGAIVALWLGATAAFAVYIWKRRKNAPTPK